MKYAKLLGLLAVAAAAPMAFAGTASATITSAGTAYNGTIEATAGSSTLTGGFSTVKCGHSLIKGELTTNDPTVASGPVRHLAWTECNYTVTTSTKGGTLTAESIGNNEATITSSGAEVTVHGSVGTCIFTTKGTHLGILKSGKPASLPILAELHRTGGNFLCGTKATWSTTYTVTTPGELVVD